MSDATYLPIEADAQLKNIHEQAQLQRFGHYEVSLQGLTIYCHDLLSFYFAAKDIFINRIYDFDTHEKEPYVIDGGAHIGLFTLFCRAKFPRARMVLFEPEAESLMLLEKNLKANNCEDVTLVRAGLFKETGEVPFYSDHSDGSTMFADDTPLRIPVVKLSDYLTKPVAFLKLNIEGAELEVMREVGAKLEQVSRVVIEYHGFPELGQKLHPILAILAERGFRYSVHDFDTETNPATKPPFALDVATRFFLLIYGQRILPVQRAAAALGSSDIGTRTEPVSRLFGYDRGTPIDRYYIERFLKTNQAHITGHVLELADNGYTQQFGQGVTQSDVLAAEANEATTLVGDIADAGVLPANRYQCIILTQCLNVIYDVRGALNQCRTALASGGVLLLTVPCISQISRYDMDRWGDFWRFTQRGLGDLLAECFPDAHAQMNSHGNLALARAFLDGLAVEDIPNQLWEQDDPDYPLIITAAVTLT